LPTDLLKAAQRVVNAHGSLYTSVGDLLKEALREKLERLNSLPYDESSKK
jgi:hypothetical protein